MSDTNMPTPGRRFPSGHKRAKKCELAPPSPHGNGRLLDAFDAGASHCRPSDLAHWNDGPGFERAGAVSHSEAGEPLAEAPL